MATQQDFDNKPFPILVRNVEEAGNFGRKMMRSLLDLKVPDREIVPMSEEIMENWGAQIGVGMFRDGSLWTAKEFTGRFRQMVEKHT